MLSQYTAGKVRKSRREKEQEAADAKRREKEANAAQVYAEFLVKFEGGETIGQRAGASFVNAESKAAYTPFDPSLRTPSTTSQIPKPKGKRAMHSFLEEIKKVLSSLCKSHLLGLMNFLNREQAERGQGISHLFFSVFHFEIEHLLPKFMVMKDLLRQWALTRAKVAAKIEEIL